MKVEEKTKDAPVVEKSTTPISDTLAIVFLVVFAVVLIVVCLGSVYYNVYHVPAQMHDQFYQHYWYEGGCDDRTTLTCLEDEELIVPTGTRIIGKDRTVYRKMYCIPKCEMGFLHPFPTTISWKWFCSETALGYSLFNRTLYEETAPPALRRDAGDEHANGEDEPRDEL